jgi:hypothetical protein
MNEPGLSVHMFTTARAPRAKVLQQKRTNKAREKEDAGGLKELSKKKKTKDGLDKGEKHARRTGEASEEGYGQVVPLPQSQRLALQARFSVNNPNPKF